MFRYDTWKLLAKVLSDSHKMIHPVGSIFTFVNFYSIKVLSSKRKETTRERCLRLLYPATNYSLQNRSTVRDWNYINILYAHIIRYCTPATLSYAWSFGSLLGFYFVLQVLTGLWLTSYYDPGIANAFESVIKITQQVKYGSFVRYMHSNGASMIFILLYLHIARGLYYRSFSYSRKSAWITGLIMFLLTMGVAFIGYVLPWGQMSYWGVTVITNLLTAIPYIGGTIQGWLLGGYGPGPTTLTRFYGLHVVLPFVILALIVLHIALLHKSGSTAGTAITDPEGIGFHPYFSVKDLYGLSFSLLIFGYLVCFEPNLLGHPDNYIPANPLATPAHIVPEWYFTPFYAILRAFPDKTMGAFAMVLSILVLGIIPFVHYWSVFTLKRFLLKGHLNGLQNIKQEVWSLQNAALNWHLFFFWSFFFNFITLILAGGLPAEDPFIFYTRLYTTFYFLYFLIIIPGLPYLDFLLIKLLKSSATPGVFNPKDKT